ncbi:serine O-acetyltransferase [Bacillus changyiensis]|uniref:serine O-acetyltransferase n=1 Tax=Bacillus changyiensis TaxID=3004103 RepID=UPI0022E84E85|nr:serine acetyltransferase [Bacillus changyiensis]MDA1475780.1 serine acetyltransferase [Bacillus changyiensis]
MISTKKELHYYLEQDKKSLGISHRKPRLLGDDIWKYQICLRKYEYYANTNSKFLKQIYRYLHKKKGLKLGFDIPINVFGPGLRINHCGLLIVNSNAKIGTNCDIHQGVNIGQNHDEYDVPTIGDNVWIGPGAKLFGKIKIANGIKIGANAVVNKSFTEENITIAGVPATKVNGAKQ